MEKINIIGIGPGNARSLTLEAAECIQRADIVYAARRHASLAGASQYRPLEPISAALAGIRLEWESGVRVAVLVSGDVGLYSMLPMLAREFGRENIAVTAGIGALQAFCAALAEPWQHACILSAHGRNLSASSLVSAASTHASVFVFCDSNHSPNWVCRALECSALYDADIEIAVGERLSYPNQRIFKGSVQAALQYEFDSLCIVRIQNLHPASGLPPVGIADDAFMRGNTPMTKREVRILALAALKLAPESVVWDIGAGTGSVTIECARQCSEGNIIAIERDAAALSLLRQNVDKFKLSNVEIVAGRAPEALAGLPIPTHAFLGGSGGEIDDIIALLEHTSERLRLVATAVTLENTYALVNRLTSWNNVEAYQASINRLEPVGRYHMLKAQNPIFIISADWEDMK